VGKWSERSPLVVKGPGSNSACARLFKKSLFRAESSYTVAGTTL